MKRYLIWHLIDAQNTGVRVYEVPKGARYGSIYRAAKRGRATPVVIYKSLGHARRAFPEARLVRDKFVDFGT